MTFFNEFTVFCDAPRPWGLYFQDSASPQMEALIELHDNIMFYLVIILFGVAWIMVSIIRNYVFNKYSISNKYLKHDTLIELIWTITPALILILIAFPSFKLLYLMDEVTDTSLTVFVEGHQWYWSYQYPDFISNDDEELEFDSYLVPESDLEEGALRLLEVDNRVIISESGIIFNCEHSGNGSECGACSSMGSHKSSIGKCIHKWGLFDYDKYLIGTPCDLGSVSETHPVSRRISDKVWYCSKCFAVGCFKCVDL